MSEYERFTTGEMSEYGEPCRECGSTTTPLHTNYICGNCYDGKEIK